MTAVDELAAFVHAALDAEAARLDEDFDVARVAAAVTRSPWTSEGPTVICADGFPVVSHGDDEPATMQHIARWDPGGVLELVEQGRRDIEAKQRILDLHRGVEADDVPGLIQCRVDAQRQPCETIRLLGLGYAGHDGYQSTWAPQHVPTNEVVEYPGDDR